MTDGSDDDLDTAAEGERQSGKEQEEGDEGEEERADARALGVTCGEYSYQMKVIFANVSYIFPWLL